MRRYVRVLAATAVTGLQVAPGYVSVVVAQNQLAPVVVTGPSSGGGSGCWPNCTGLYSGGSSGGGGSSSIPENEAYGRPPGPPVRTPEQRQADKQKCEDTRTENLADARMKYQAGMQVCATRSGNNWYGYINEIVLGALPPLVGQPPQDCWSTVDRLYENGKKAINDARDACVAVADRPY